jgi:hypothetical protein
MPEFDMAGVDRDGRRHLATVHTNVPQEVCDDKVFTDRWLVCVLRAVSDDDGPPVFAAFR